MSKYDEAIDKGIALLDAKVPEWCTKMQLDHLHMADGDSCVLGQLFQREGNSSGYHLGSDKLGLKWWDTEYGFFTRDKWGPLTRRWKQRILQHCKARGD